MARTRVVEREGLFTRHIQAKVTDKVYARLKKVQENSNCRTIGEAVRLVLSREQIIVYEKDATMQAPLEEIIRLRKEIKAIGVNINQVTHAFHGMEPEKKKVYQALRIAEEYKKVGDKVDRLFGLILEMGKKWSRG